MAESQKYSWKRVEIGLRRLENCIETLLERLSQHKKNIIEYEKSGERKLVMAELKKSSQIIEEINTNLKGSSNLRRQLKTEEDSSSLEERLQRLNETVRDKILEFKTVSDEFKEYLGTDLQFLMTEEKLDCKPDRQISTQTQRDNKAEARVRAELTLEEDTTERCEQISQDVEDLRDVMVTLHQTIQDQGEQVNSIESNIEKTHENIKKGGFQLNKAAVLQASGWAVVGAAVGTLIGGPIGLVAGAKLGLVAAGAGGVTGSLVGRQLKKKRNEHMEIELQNLQAASNTAETRKLRSRTNTVQPDTTGDTETNSGRDTSETVQLDTAEDKSDNCNGAKGSRRYLSRMFNWNSS